MSDSQLIYHYNTNGKSEDRIVSQESFVLHFPNFSLSVYRKANSDLQVMSDFELMVHFFYNGRFENREFHGSSDIPITTELPKELPKELPIVMRELKDECQEFFRNWSDHIWWSIDVIRNAFLQVDPFQPDAAAGIWIPLLKLYNVVIEQGEHLSTITKPEFGEKLSEELVYHVHQARNLILILVQGGRGTQPANAWGPFYQTAESADSNKQNMHFGFNGTDGILNYFPVKFVSPVGNVGPATVTSYDQVGYTKSYPNGLTFDEAFNEWLLNGDRIATIYGKAFGISAVDLAELKNHTRGHLISTIVEYCGLLDARNKFLNLLNNKTYFTTNIDKTVSPTKIMSGIIDCIGMGESDVLLDNNQDYNFYKAREGVLGKYTGSSDFQDFFNAMSKCLALADHTANHVYCKGYHLRNLCEKYICKNKVQHVNDRFEYLIEDYIWWVGLFLRAEKGRPYINMGMLNRLYENADEIGQTFGQYCTLQSGKRLGELFKQNINLLVNYQHCVKQKSNVSIYISPNSPKTINDSLNALKVNVVAISNLLTEYIGNGNVVEYSHVFNHFNKIISLEVTLINTLFDPVNLVQRKLEAGLGGSNNEVNISEGLYDSAVSFEDLVVVAMENNMVHTGEQMNMNIMHSMSKIIAHSH